MAAGTVVASRLHRFSGNVIRRANEVEWGLRSLGRVLDMTSEWGLVPLPRREEDTFSFTSSHFDELSVAGRELSKTAQYNR